MNQHNIPQTTSHTTTHYWGYRELDASELKHVAGGDDGGGDGGGGDYGGDVGDGGGNSDGSGGASSGGYGAAGSELDGRGDGGGCDFATNDWLTQAQPELAWLIDVETSFAPPNTPSTWSFYRDGLY